MCLALGLVGARGLFTHSKQTSLTTNRKDVGSLTEMVDKRLF